MTTAELELPRPPPVSGSILENGSTESVIQDTKEPQSAVSTLDSSDTCAVEDGEPITEEPPPLPRPARKSSVSFAPLPRSDRPRRNSITLGVAARSQILRSQGAGKGPRPTPVPAPPPKPVHIYEGGDDWSKEKKEKVVDLGEVGKKLWKKWRQGNTRGSGKSMSTEEAAEKEALESEGRAPLSVVDSIEEVKEETTGAEPKPTPGSPPPELTDSGERPLVRRGSADKLVLGTEGGSQRRQEAVLGFDSRDTEGAIEEAGENVPNV